ncbi:MAG TPA: amidohydrolase family protein [Pseudolabrys sp.]|uniref:amidohydrolase family protein n=1 Tax=Pseudolabrys sp. TaxID=1960880 RepID=UPI002DDD2274|nr:amidohydrolase family protein [Pseudolabrys sp.]HEV2630918.1 amidohydrolase family protein [Pseudolabrys sp.]
MQYFDCHSHFSTEAGLHHASQEDYEQAQRVFKRKRTFETEEEMAAGFRKRHVRTILDIYRTWRLTDEDEIRRSHDYVIDFTRKNPDIVYGNWVAINPSMKDFWLKEFRRLLDAKVGFWGFCQSQNSLGFTPSDPVWDPFYKLSIEIGAPVLLMTGLTGIGQGMPGGKGIVLEDGHPRHVDRVAARYPELKIVAGRPAWPWQDDMIAIMLHKANVHYELHGWSPKYFTPALKKEIGWRLQDRIMFGWDWPTLTLERLVEDWRSLGYTEEVYEKVFHRNAEAFFPGAAPK